MAAQDLFAAAVAQANQGRYAAAHATLIQLLEAERGHAAAWAMRGSLELELGEAAAALDSYDTALRLRPDHAPTQTNRANALSRLRRFDEAVDGYAKALALDPTLAQAHNNRALALNESRRHAEAAASAEAALALAPDYANAWLQLGGARLGMGRHAEAIEALERAQALGCDPEACLSAQGEALAALGRYDEALQKLDAAVALAPQSPAPHYARARIRLARGDFAGGWADYEHRWRARGFLDHSWRFGDAIRERLTTAPRPSDLAGRRVAVLAEQGVGDQIMFASLLPDLVRSQAQVTLVSDPRMVRLFRRSFPDIAVVGTDASGALASGQFDVVVAMGSLAAAYRLSAAQFPGEPYLRPAPEVVEAWRGRLGPGAGRLRVGLSWHGGAQATGGRARSMPLAELVSGLARTDCDFVSLQYGDVQAEVEAVNRTLDRPIQCFAPAEIDDFEDLAGLVGALDLVVSVQTALIHLCGALGRPCLTMVPRVPEWRYMAAGEAMPWYRSVRIFRQSDDGAWGPVLDRVAAAVADAARPRA